MAESPDEHDNELSAHLALFHFDRLIDKHDFKAAKAYGEKLLAEADGMLEIRKNALLCELLFLEIIGEAEPREIKRLYTKKL